MLTVKTRYASDLVRSISHYRYSSMPNLSNDDDGRKRKRAEASTAEPGPPLIPLGMEMPSDEEDGEAGLDSHSDDSSVEEFPEIFTGSEDEGSDEDDENEQDEDEDEDEEDEEASSNTAVSDDDSSLHIFPKSKTIVSSITGQPRRVYPEIEADYDSDSSTEDVRNTSHIQPRDLHIHA
jgi:ribosome biogenesis protein ERB1